LISIGSQVSTGGMGAGSHVSPGGQVGAGAAPDDPQAEPPTTVHSKPCSQSLFAAQVDCAKATRGASEASSSTAEAAKV
jgi:hypothetical protein